MKKSKLWIPAVAMGLISLWGCSDDSNGNGENDDDKGKELADDWYTGGKLGTSFNASSSAYEQPAAVIESSGMYQSFKHGEALFEKPFTSNTEGTRSGLGPAYVRSSCQHCHPGYGHGKSIPTGAFETNEIGNGYLLVVFNPSTNGYVTWLAGMPQMHATKPFKAPVDGSKIRVEWKEYTDEWGNKFPDGESYQLRYPEVTMPKEALYVVNQGYEIPAADANYKVLLESTIGIYGTGLIDAIEDSDIKAQYAQEEKDGYLKHGLNPSIFKDGEWVKQYSNSKQGDGTLYPLRYTYALSRGPLQDAAGANAIWNITNVTRSDRRYHYLDAAGTYATYSSKDPEVQAGFPAYIAQIDPEKKHSEWHTDNVEDNIKNYLTSTTLDAEMSDQDFIDLMVWHRGLAVPAARDLDDEEVQLGKKLFSEIGCDYCHRPTWTTGSDIIRDPAKFFKYDDDRLPRFPNQKIWPYTDMVQHKLCMENDIRTGWCRTTPLWGRGLHQKCTGSSYADRLHDCRARTTMEAIMWHGNSESDARYPVEKFRNLKKEERAAIVKFLDAI